MIGKIKDSVATDLTLGGFLTACLVFCVLGTLDFILHIWDDIYRFSYIAGLLGYFIYIAYRKDKTRQKWETIEVMSGFIATLAAKYVVGFAFSVGLTICNGIF